LTTMRLQMCLVLGLIVLLDNCLVEAKPQVQNCASSNCNQNNFGRKRRQILEEILTGMEADEDAKVVKRQVQNCQGSQCNQNNLRPIAPGPVETPPQVVVQPPPSVPDVQPPPPVPVVQPSSVVPIVQPPPPVVVEPSPVVPIVQPPPAVVVQPPLPVDQPVPVVGPVAPGLGPFPEGFPFTEGNPFTPGFPFAAGGSPFPPGFPFAGAGGSGGAGGAQVQNCQGSVCNQNNLGRKKRQIAEAINALTAEVLEAEDEAVAEDFADLKVKRDADADAQSQNCFGSSCNQNNFGRRKREVIAALLEELV